MKKIELSIDGRRVEIDEGMTVLEAANKANIAIPALCFHPDLRIRASCRICSVEVEGMEELQPSCSLKAENGMIVKTDSLRIRKARRINLELIFSQHCEECHDCIWRFNCRMLDFARECGADIAKFKDRKKNYPTYNLGPFLEFDASKCIDCRNCIEVCESQGIGHLKVRGRGHLLEVIPSKDNECVYCGQCIVHCPAGAFEASGEFEKIEDPLLEKGKKTVFQFAPALRVSIGEEFGLPPGSLQTRTLTAALKALGAYRVFDVCAGADFTTVEEAGEFLERLKKNEKLPMMTSCCPSWVRFVECYYPELIPNLTSARSPHVILGGIIKEYWAPKEGLRPEEVSVVSIMPCVSKKYEIERRELKIGKIKPVDFVLTARELARLIKKNGIDFSSLEGELPDNPFGDPSGSGVIYGASGGVMESALRAVNKKISKKDDIGQSKIARGMSGIKTGEVKIGDNIVRIAVANGLGNARKLIEKIKKDPRLYDYIEVMACPGGCIGGGGQPVPTSKEIGEKRAKGLYSFDKESKKKLPENNPAVKKVYENFLNNENMIKRICHTKYFNRKYEKNSAKKDRY